MLKRTFIIVLLSCILFSCDDSDSPEKITPELDFLMEKTTLDSELSKPLGYEQLTVKAGEYSVDYCEENYGTVSLELENLVRNSEKSSTLKSGFGPRIRIATRRSNCSGGIGFRCGLVKVEINQIMPERDKLVQIDIDEETKTMNIEFLEPVDWEKLRSE